MTGPSAAEPPAPGPPAPGPPATDFSPRQPTRRLADLAGRHVAVWGLGREGAAAARAALRAGAARVVAVSDAAPPAAELEAWSASGLAAVAVRGLDALGAADVVVLSPGVSRYRAEVGTLLAHGVPVQGGTDPAPETPAEVASAQRQLKVLQWVIPALTGGIVVLNALHGEQQRPNQQVPGILQGAAQLTGATD